MFFYLFLSIIVLFVFKLLTWLPCGSKPLNAVLGGEGGGGGRGDGGRGERGGGGGSGRKRENAFSFQLGGERGEGRGVEEAGEQVLLELGGCPGEGGKERRREIMMIVKKARIVILK